MERQSYPIPKPGLRYSNICIPVHRDTRTIQRKILARQTTVFNRKGNLLAELFQRLWINLEVGPGPVGMCVGPTDASLINQMFQLLMQLPVAPPHRGISGSCFSGLLKDLHVLVVPESSAFIYLRWFVLV